MLNAPLSQILNQRLWLEIAIRNKFSGLIHLGLCVVGFFISKPMYLAHPLTLSSFGLILVGNFYREIALRKITHGSPVTKNLAILHNASLTVIGIGWSLFWYDINHYYGRYSVHGVFGLMTLSALVSGGVSPQSPKPINYLCFAFFLLLIPSIVFFYGVDENFYLLAFCMTLYVCYNLYQLRISHLTIKRLLLNEISATTEKNKLQTLINAVPGYVCCIDQDLRFVMINELAQKVFNLRNKINQSIKTDNPDSPFVSFVTAFMSENKPSAVTEMELNLNPGKTMVFMSIQKNPDLMGGAAIVAIPMEELLEAREKVKAQEVKSFHTSKLISLGEMAAGIAHEINNPLAIIMGCSDQINRALKREVPDLENVKTLNNKIQTTVERIAAIIKSLRILSGNGEREPLKPIDVNTILDHGIQLSRRRFQNENVDLTIAISQEPIQCLGQETQLSQVMMNLLSNAFDAAVSGKSPRWVKISVTKAEGWISITVQDSGEGISQDAKQRIMEPFFTTKPLNKGTGLGLSISKSIMDQHEGSLTLDDTQVHTTFIVRLKAAPGI